MAKRIDADVLDVLEQCTVEGAILRLPGVKLERKLYEGVNKVLELIGGKWNRGKQGHLFSEDPTDLLATVLSTGEVTDVKEELQAFFTPPAVVDRLIELAELRPGLAVLEPSAGAGAIAVPVLREIVPNERMVTCEIHQPFVDRLRKDGFEVFAGDFLAKIPNPAAEFDRVVMNPPFSRQQDVDHVLHAFRFLKPGGILVAVMSPSWQFRDNKKSADFRAWLQSPEISECEVEELEEGAFKESGTNVRTVILKAIAA